MERLHADRPAQRPWTRLTVTPPLRLKEDLTYSSAGQIVN